MTTEEVRAWKKFCESVGHPVTEPDGHCDCGQTIVDEAGKLSVIPDSRLWPWVYSFRAPGCRFRFRIQLNRYRLAIVRGEWAVGFRWRRDSDTPSDSRRE